MFSGTALDNTVIPEPLDGDTIMIDGEALRAIVVGQADIPNNTVLHIPSIAAVVAGDVIYNGINPFLAESDAAGWHAWLESIAKVAELEPRLVVAGHKRAELADDASPRRSPSPGTTSATSSPRSMPPAAHVILSSGCSDATPTSATRARWSCRPSRR